MIKIIDDFFTRRIRDKVNNLASKRRYYEAVQELKKIKKIEDRISECYNALTIIGTVIAINQYGRVYFIENREEYERIKKGLDKEIPSQAALYRNIKNDEIEGLESMFEIVPGVNPLKQYYEELKSPR